MPVEPGTGPGRPGVRYRLAGVVLRKVVICILAAGVAAATVIAAGAGAAARPQLAPGITYEKQVQFTRRGPLVLHTITAPKPTGDYRLEPVLSNGAITGRERLSVIARRLGAQVVSVSGDLFYPDGRPHGIVMQNGVLHHAPALRRSSLGIDAAGNLNVTRVELNATWNGTGQRRPVMLNREPTRNGVSLFTSAWGPVTPGASTTIEAVVSGLPATVPNVELSGQVAQLRQGNGPIPPGSAVLVGRGAGGQQLVAEAAVGPRSASGSHSSRRGPESCLRSAVARHSCARAAGSSVRAKPSAPPCSPRDRPARASASAPTDASCSSWRRADASGTASACRTTSSRAPLSAREPSRASRSHRGRARRWRATASC